MTYDSRIRGYIYAIASAASLGLIPLFFIPLQKSGISTETLAAYRFGVSALILLPFMRIAGISMKVSLGELAAIALIGLDFMLSTYFMFYSLLYLPSSVAIPLLYLYPTMVLFIMLFFGEKFNLRYILVLGLVIAGVWLLSQGPAEEFGAAGAPRAGDALLGVCLALGAGLCMALLNVSLKVSRVSGIDGIALTFYLLLFSFAYIFLQSLFTAPLQWIGDLRRLGLVVLFAFITGVLANVFLIWAIKLIGPTLASILAVIQPLTSVLCGILVFGDPMSIELGAGFCVTVAAVFLAVAKPRAA